MSDSDPVHPFTIIILGGVGGLVVALLLLGRLAPGNGERELDWKPTRSAETEVQNEIDDFDQMLEATNRRRRARGEAELTEESLRATVSANLRDSTRLRDDYLEDLEIAQVLDVKNRRRIAQGLPLLTLDEFRASLSPDKGPR